MRVLRLISIITLMFCFATTQIGFTQVNDAGKDALADIDAARPADEKLVVLWTSGDRDVALKMVFMYTYNAKRFGWWDDVTFIVWGPSSKLLSVDQELQTELAKMKDLGIKLEACQACADQYGVSDKLREFGIDVKYMGQALTDYIKEGRHVLTL